MTAPLTEARIREIIREEIDAARVIAAGPEVDRSAYARAVALDRARHGSPAVLANVLSELRDAATTIGNQDRARRYE